MTREIPEPKEVATALNAFAIDLYRTMKVSEENAIISPFGVGTALTMLQLGATGSTAEEIVKTLHFNWTGPMLARGISSILTELRKSFEENKVPDQSIRTDQLNIANALWVQQQLPIVPQYSQWIREYFQGTLFQVDFKATEQTRAQINAWVAKQTRGKIAEALAPHALTDTPIMGILSAIYFNGRWEQAFPIRETRTRPFYLLNGRSIGLPLMHVKTNLKFVENGDVQYVELPYHGKTLTMGILLPVKRDGLPSVEASLTNDQLTNLMDTCRDQKVQVFLPRFKVDSISHLLPMLHQLGVVTAMNRAAAEFSLMTSDPQGVYLAEALHQACIEVDEEGTVAAAVTAKYMVLMGIEMSPIIMADHPFLFIIRHIPTGQIIFLGRWTGIGPGGIPVKGIPIMEGTPKIGVPETLNPPLQFPFGNNLQHFQDQVRIGLESFARNPDILQSSIAQLLSSFSAPISKDNVLPFAFSSGGRILQEEYAQQAADNQGLTTIGVSYSQGVVIVKKTGIDTRKPTWVAPAHQFIYHPDEKIAITTCGIDSDGRLITTKARDFLLDPANSGATDIAILADFLARFIHHHTLRQGYRMLGVNVLIGGLDLENMPRLFTIDATGMLWEVQVYAIGQHRRDALATLLAGITRVGGLEDATRLALSATFSGTEVYDDYIVVVIDQDSKRFRALSPEEKNQYRVQI